MAPPVTSGPPQVAEEALHMLEEASSEHLEWLKSIHCSLLFHGGRPAVSHCRAVEDGLAAKISDHFGRGHAAFEHLKQARQRMELLGRHLTERAGRGEQLDPETYLSFMEAVENYHAQGRQVELLLHQALAETDPLTGLLNRRGMMRDLHREWGRASRSGSSCCIALVDLDHFKGVNDTFGHLAGDEVLSTAARFFLRRLRSYDLVYRFGGEEFLFCLPNTRIEQAKRILERLRLLMARLIIRSPDGQRMGVTISIGVAQMAPEISPEATIARADQALYAAKANGRNRVEVACEAAPA